MVTSVPSVLLPLKLRMPEVPLLPETPRVLPPVVNVFSTLIRPVPMLQDWLAVRTTGAANVKRFALPVIEMPPEPMLSVEALFALKVNVRLEVLVCEIPKTFRPVPMLAAVSAVSVLSNRSESTGAAGGVGIAGTPGAVQLPLVVNAVVLLALVQIVAFAMPEAKATVMRDEKRRRFLFFTGGEG